MLIATCPRVLPAVSARVKLRLNIGPLRDRDKDKTKEVM